MSRLAQPTSWARRFVSFHILVAVEWTIQQGHDLAENIETDIKLQINHFSVFTHVEPIEDPRALVDQQLGPLGKSQEIAEKTARGQYLGRFCFPKTQRTRTFALASTSALHLALLDSGSGYQSLRPSS